MVCTDINQHRRSRRRFLQFALLFTSTACLSLSGCTTSSQQRDVPNAKLRVVATSTILADLTATIGGEAIEVIGILKPGTDPHVYEPVPTDSRAFEEADLTLYNGYNLEPGLIKLMNASGSNTPRIPIGEVVKPLQLDRKNKPTVPDPHVWGDVKNVIRMVEAIRQALSDRSPTHKAKFDQNADRLTKELTQLDRWIGQQIQTIPPNQRRLVTTHDAFQYYARAYSLEIIGTLIGISTEEQPSAQTVQALVESVKSSKAPAIFAETTINPTLIQTVAQEAGVKLAPRPLYSDSIGAPNSDGNSYIKMMTANTCVITEALGGKCTPFVPSL